MKFEVIEKDAFDDDAEERRAATADTWEEACRELDDIKKGRTPRQNLSYSLEIREMEGQS